MTNKKILGNTAVLIESPTYQEREVIVWVQENVVNKCPYEGPPELEQEFKTQVNLFFWHILQSSLYPSKRDQKKKFGRVWVPFPKQLGQDKLPLVFGTPYGARRGARKDTTREGTFSRALEWLKENILIVKGYSRDKGLCREFRIRPEILEGMYGTLSPKTSEEILRRTRFYSPLLKAVQERYGITVMETIQRSSLLPFVKPEHDLKHLCRNRDRAARKLYGQVLDKLLPNEISIQPILDYLEDKSMIPTIKARKQYLQVKRLLDTIIGGPIQIVSAVPLVIRYYAKYRVARIGGRLFEIGGGFQNLPGELKEKCFTVGTNWDMKSSQLNVLKQEFEKYSIDCGYLSTIGSIDDIADLFRLDKKAAKICFYATIFSAGQLETSPKSNVRKTLKRSMGPTRAREFVIDWNTYMSPLYFALTTLLNKYEVQFRKNKETSLLRCATGAQYEPAVNDTSKKIKKRALNHIISGQESAFLFDAILNCPNVKGVYSLEHDGALMEVDGEIESTFAHFLRKRFSDKVIFME